MALADASVGVNKTVQQILLERELQRMGVSPAQLAQRNQARQDEELNLRRQEMAQRSQELTANHERQSRMDASAEQQRVAGEANTLGDQLPPGVFMPSQDPAVGMMQQGGRGSLLQPSVKERPAMGDDFTGPMDTGETPQEAQTGKQKGFLKTRSQKQVDTDTDNKRQQSALDSASADRASAREDRQALSQYTREHTAERDKATDAYRGAQLKQGQARIDKPAAPITIQTVDAEGNAVTRIVPKTVGSEFKKAPSATVANRLASAEAVTQTGQDIINKLSDPAVKAVVGPAMGRYKTLQDFIGNPPPEFSDLAGSIESYALANMGVHGMRSVEGANQIKSLLSAHHTPESLIAAINGLNRFSVHFMENEGRGGRTTAPTSGAKPSAADLIKKYGGP